MLFRNNWIGKCFFFLQRILKVQHNLIYLWAQLGLDIHTETEKSSHCNDCVIKRQGRKIYNARKMVENTHSFGWYFGSVLLKEKVRKIYDLLLNNQCTIHVRHFFLSYFVCVCKCFCWNFSPWVYVSVRCCIFKSLNLCKWF